VQPTCQPTWRPARQYEAGFSVSPRRSGVRNMPAGCSDAVSEPHVREPVSQPHTLRERPAAQPPVVSGPPDEGPRRPVQLPDPGRTASGPLRAVSGRFGVRQGSSGHEGSLGPKLVSPSIQKHDAPFRFCPARGITYGDADLHTDPQAAKDADPPSDRRAGTPARRHCGVYGR